jgi:hypothetical protein
MPTRARWAGTKAIFAPEGLTLALRCWAGMVPSSVPAVFDADLKAYATWRRGPIRCDTATPANDAMAMATMRTPYVSTRLPDGCQAA